MTRVTTPIFGYTHPKIFQPTFNSNELALTFVLEIRLNSPFFHFCCKFFSGKIWVHYEQIHAFLTPNSNQHNAVINIRWVKLFPIEWPKLIICRIPLVEELEDIFSTTQKIGLTKMMTCNIHVVFGQFGQYVFPTS